MGRSFTQSDQLRFAQLSGDYNPIHVDPVAARRFLYGQQVVHGVHALMWAIDVLLTQLEASSGISTRWGIDLLRVGFHGPVFLDVPHEVKVSPAKNGRWKLEVAGRGTRLLSAEVGFREHDVSRETRSLATFPPAGEACQARTRDELQHAAGELKLFLEPALANSLFPRLARRVSHDDLATLLATTRLVGMDVPGMNSLFIGLKLSAAPQTGSSMTYAVESYDERFSVMSISAKGPSLSGSLSAAVRPSPRAQLTYADACSLVRAGEFAGQRALVIGGSRGLGEVIVKEIVAGGGEVRFSYNRGEQEATQIIDDMASVCERVACFQYAVNSGRGRLDQLLRKWRPTTLYYFPTPYIGKSTPGQFSSADFRTFCDIYVSGFAAVFTEVQSLSPDFGVALYPSSVTIDEGSPDFAEYIAAKAAGEAICRVLSVSNPSIRILVPRLPRLSTDQTASLLPMECDNPAAFLLKLLRQMSGRYDNKDFGGLR